MMLLWLAITFVFPDRWSAFKTIIACGAPMLLVGTKFRGKTFGTRDCNTAAYKDREYLLFFAFCICGAALISAITFFTVKAFGTETVGAENKGFFYSLVFLCFIPAFFEV